MAQLHGLDQIGFVRKLMAHPAYDGFWQAQALDKILQQQGLTVPTMLVHSLWIKRTSTATSPCTRRSRRPIPTTRISTS